MVSCKNCIHFKRAPYEANRTGCWHPENMPQKHSEAFLQEQQIPGNHEVINLRGDCPRFEARPARPGLLARILAALSGRDDLPAAPASPA